MDFLWLFLIYTVALILGVAAFCCLSGRARNRLDSVIYRTEEALSYVLPPWLYRGLTSSFHTRSALFVYLHLILNALVFAEYTWEVLGYSLEMEMHWTLVLLPYILMAVNLYFYYKCCTTDPGRVTEMNEALCTELYQYDNILFHQGRECETCQLMKPARSKHCSKKSSFAKYKHNILVNRKQGGNLRPLPILPNYSHQCSDSNPCATPV